MRQQPLLLTMRATCGFLQVHGTFGCKLCYVVRRGIEVRVS